MNTLTVLPFLIAFAIGLGQMRPLDIYQVNAYNVGTLKVEPWRGRTAPIARAINRVGTWFRDRFGLFIRSELGEVAVPTLADVQKALEEGNRLFTQFQETNNKRMEQLEKRGVVDPLITAKLDKLSEAMDAHSALNEQLIAMQARLNKFEKFQSDPDDPKAKAKELRDFNRSAKVIAAAYGRPAPPDLTAEQYAALKEAEDTYLRNRPLSEAQRNAMTVGNDPQGGYLVTPDTSGRIVERVYETSPMRQYAGNQTISTDALEGSVDLDEATFGWVGETGTRNTDNGPKAPAPWRIPVHEAYAQPKLSQKLIEDANVDVRAWIGRKVGDKFGRGYNVAFVTGNGVAKPRGFASYTTAATADASRNWGVFEHIATGTSGGFGTDPNGVNKLLDLIHALKDVYTQNAAFYMNRTTLGKARQLTDASSQGKYVFIPSFIAGQPDTLMGYPVRKLQDMATYSTASSLAIAFGDMKETYLIVDRLGLTLLVDPYTAKPFVVFYTRGRVGGDVVNFESLKFLKFASS